MVGLDLLFEVGIIVRLLYLREIVHQLLLFLLQIGIRLILLIIVVVILSIWLIIGHACVSSGIVVSVHLIDTVELHGGRAGGAINLFIIRLTLNLLLFRVIMLETTWLVRGGNATTTTTTT